MIYLQILFEAAHTASIVPFASEPTFFAMKAFGGYNMALALAMAVAGAMIGQAFNWSMGRLLSKLGALLLPFQKERDRDMASQGYSRVATWFQKYGAFLLVVCPLLPLGNMIVVAAGLFGTRFKVALPLVLIGEMVNYIRYAV